MGSAFRTAIDLGGLLCVAVAALHCDAGDGLVVDLRDATTGAAFDLAIDRAIVPWDFSDQASEPIVPSVDLADPLPVNVQQVVDGVLQCETAPLFAVDAIYTTWPSQSAQLQTAPSCWSGYGRVVFSRVTVPARSGVHVRLLNDGFAPGRGLLIFSDCTATCRRLGSRAPVSGSTDQLIANPSDQPLTAIIGVYLDSSPGSFRLALSQYALPLLGTRCDEAIELPPDEALVSGHGADLPSGCGFENPLERTFAKVNLPPNTTLLSHLGYARMHDLRALRDCSTCAPVPLRNESSATQTAIAVLMPGETYAWFPAPLAANGRCTGAKPLDPGTATELVRYGVGFDDEQSCSGAPRQPLFWTVQIPPHARLLLSGFATKVDDGQGLALDVADRCGAPACLVKISRLENHVETTVENPGAEAKAVIIAIGPTGDPVNGVAVQLLTALQSY